MEEPPDPPEALAMGSSDLRFLLSSHNVDELSQSKLFENGIDTLAKFAAFVTSEEELTKVLKASFGLDAEASLKVRGQVASYLVAWQTAKTRIKMQATSELREWAKPIPQTDYVAMRHAYAKSYGDLEDKQIPSKEYLEKKLHELENGEFRAEALTEVVSRDEVDPDTLLPVWDAKGHITVKRANTTVAMPTGPEQLRMRLTVMANTLIMMRMKHTARNELKNITPAFFEKYKDYLLGDYVYGLRASDDYGGMIPPWTLVLSYEHAIRKHCYKTMTQQGLPFKLALEQSWKDATVKERHFTTPLAIYAKRGYTATSAATATSETTTGKGIKKGKGKAKGKKGHATTPANRPICFRYNSKGGCKKKGKCHFEHVCTLCFGNHPATECSQRDTRDTQGKAN